MCCDKSKKRKRFVVKNGEENHRLTQIISQIAQNNEERN